MPIVKNGAIKRYEYYQYIYILDILSDTIAENPAKIDESVQRFLENIKQDVSKKDHIEELVIDDKTKKKSVNQVIDYMFEEYENPYIGMA